MDKGCAGNFTFIKNIPIYYLEFSPTVKTIFALKWLKHMP